MLWFGTVVNRCCAAVQKMSFFRIKKFKRRKTDDPIVEVVEKMLQEANKRSIVYPKFFSNHVFVTF